jgi:hypothetical protein
MRKLKSITSFKKQSVNSLELSNVSGGRANASERVDGVCTGDYNYPDCGFKLDGTFVPYPGKEGTAQC